jgi:hypothetical protein
MKCAGEEPVWVSWVKKINDKSVVQDRLLAVGFYRIFSIKRTKTGKKQVTNPTYSLPSPSLLFFSFFFFSLTKAKRFFSPEDYRCKELGIS